MSDRVTCSIEGGIADVRLNRPEKRNALDGEMFTAIAEMGERLKDESRVRVVVLSGEGPSFCAGLDFSAFEQMAGGKGLKQSGGNPAERKEGSITHLGQKVSWVWQELPVPVIAAVHGHAIGGGLQIALGADIRIVHPDTQLSVREVHWGLIPDMAGTYTLSKLVRPDVAKWLLLTADMVSGRDAFDLGLATRLSDHPHDDAMVLARQIAGRSPDAIRGVKALLNQAYGGDPAGQFAAERRVIGGLVGSPNQVEAVMANFEKRPPVFKD
jgi:enoyl-CoA hydratase/carnithine racemase